MIRKEKNPEEVRQYDLFHRFKPGDTVRFAGDPCTTPVFIRRMDTFSFLQVITTVDHTDGKRWVKVFVTRFGKPVSNVHGINEDRLELDL